MPRQMGELRRLCLEWNRLAAIARERGIRVNGRRVRDRRHFHMDRSIARDRVAMLRALVASYYQPTQSMMTTATGDTFGVEIECMMPLTMTRGEVAQRIRDAGVLCQEESYNHLTRTHWKVTTDNSLGYARGAEIVSPPLSGEAGFESLRKVCNVLTLIGCKVDRNCGLHVHVGVNGRSAPFLKNLAWLYTHFEPAIDSVVSPSRRRGGISYHWCGSVAMNAVAMNQATTVEQVMAAVNQPHTAGTRSHYRYRKLNFLPFWEPGTVEFRQHQGTVESHKTEMWVRLCLRLVAIADTTSPDAILACDGGNLDEVLTFVGADTAERIYFTGRRDYFANRENRRAA